jgi:hypothetical protein
MAVPCNLLGCDLWVAKPEYLNCAVMTFGSRQHLTVAQIAQLFGGDPARIKSSIEHALVILRDELTFEAAPRQYQVCKSHVRCIVCRKRATYWADGFGYCSQTCHEWIPPVLANLEATYGLPLPQVLTLSYVMRRFARSRARDLAWQYAGVYETPRSWRRTPSPWRRPPGLPTAQLLRRRIGGK